MLLSVLGVGCWCKTCAAINYFFLDFLFLSLPLPGYPANSFFSVSFLVVSVHVCTSARSGATGELRAYLWTILFDMLPRTSGSRCKVAFDFGSNRCAVDGNVVAAGFQQNWLHPTIVHKSQHMHRFVPFLLYFVCCFTKTKPPRAMINYFFLDFLGLSLACA